MTLSNVAWPMTVSAVDELTDREAEILRFMAAGYSNPAICTELWLSPKTVESHIRGIFIKLLLPAGGTQHRRVAAVLAYLQRNAAGQTGSVTG